MILKSNQELYEYLVWLRAKLLDESAIDLANLISHAIGNASSMSTEFLGESKKALLSVVRSDHSGLTLEELTRAQGIIDQIAAALDRKPQG